MAAPAAAAAATVLIAADLAIAAVPAVTTAFLGLLCTALALF